MIDWAVSTYCAIYDCGSCVTKGCECSCHVFPRNDDGEPVSLEPYKDDTDPLRGIINGCIFGLLGWGGIALIAWAIWKAVHHA